MEPFTLLLAAAAGGLQYPATDFLEAARGVCDVALASDDPAAGIGEARWTTYTPAAGSQMEADLRDEKALFGSSSQVFAKTVTGHTLFALVNVIRPKKADVRIRTCVVQDFGADIARADVESLSDAIVAWAGRPPFDNGIRLGDDLEKGLDTIHLTRVWKPGLNEGADDTVIRYFPIEFELPNAGLSYSSERAVGAKDQGRPIQ
jgi:hypothetical protein